MVVASAMPELSPNCHWVCKQPSPEEMLGCVMECDSMDEEVIPKPAYDFSFSQNLIMLISISCIVFLYALTSMPRTNARILYIGEFEFAADFTGRPPKRHKSPKPAPQKDFEEEDDNLQCLICKTNKKVWSFQPCGHIVACHKCYKNYYPKRKKCPYCMQDCNNWVAVRV